MVASAGAVASAEAPAGRARFADPSRLKQGWYLLAASARVRRGSIRAVAVGPRRLLVYRDLASRPHVTEDRCPHLGSDLALGRVTADGLRCAFHGWCWGEGGACTAAPGNPSIPARRLRSYDVVERWGFLWAWLGGAPEFELPQIAPSAWHRWTLLPQRVRAHPDVVFANGFDLAHFGPSHGIEAATASLEVRAPWHIAHRIEGRLPHRLRLAWAGLGGRALDATFEQHGGGIVHVRVRRPLEYSILFTIRPDARGHSRTRTLLFLPRRIDLARALALLWATALDDLPLMETIAWTGACAPADAALERYVRFVEGVPAW